MDLPIVGNLVDFVVPRIEHNPIVDRLPKWIQALWALAFTLCIEAAAFLASAMVFAGALYYNFPGFAGVVTHWFSVPAGYWGYVLLMLGGFTVFAVLKAWVDGDKTDVLSSKHERGRSLDFLMTPAGLLVAGWLVVHYLA